VLRDGGFLVVHRGAQASMRPEAGRIFGHLVQRRDTRLGRGSRSLPAAIAVACCVWSARDRGDGCNLAVQLHDVGADSTRLQRMRATAASGSIASDATTARPAGPHARLGFHSNPPPAAAVS
jgi:hypothetical protein